MSSIDPSIHFDWHDLVLADTDRLLSELAKAHATIANLTVTVAYLKQEEVRAKDGAKELRLETEGLRDAYVELKWLLKTLLEHKEPS